MPDAVAVAFALLGPADRALFEALYTCPRVMRHIAAPLTVAEAQRAFARALRHNAAAQPGHRTWAVFAPQACGIVSLLRSPAHAEFGLMLTPAAWDGQCSAACVRHAVAFAFGTMQVPRVIADCRAGANARVAARLLRPYGARVEAGAADGFVRRVLYPRPLKLEPGPQKSNLTPAS